MITARELRTDPFFRASRVGALRREATLTGRSFAIAAQPGIRARIFVEANGGPPRWLDSVLSRLENLAQLRSGWDSYGARPVALETLARTVDVINDVMMEFDALEPTVVPTPVGGVQIEFHVGAEDLELSIALDQVAASYENETTGESWEGDLKQRRGDIHRVLEQMSN